MGSGRQMNYGLKWYIAYESSRYETLRIPCRHDTTVSASLIIQMFNFELKKCYVKY